MKNVNPTHKDIILMCGVNPIGLNGGSGLEIQLKCTRFQDKLRRLRSEFRLKRRNKKPLTEIRGISHLFYEFHCFQDRTLELGILLFIGHIFRILHFDSRSNSKAIHLCLIRADEIFRDR